MFIIILIILVFILIVSNKNKLNSPTLITKTDTNNNLEEKIDYKKYYTPKIFMITLNELNFYNILLEIAKEMDLIL